MDNGFFASSDLICKMEHGKSFYIFLLRIECSTKKVMNNFLLSLLYQKLLQAKLNSAQILYFPWKKQEKLCLCTFWCNLIAYRELHGKSCYIFLLRIKRSTEKVQYNLLLSLLFQRLLQAKVEFRANFLCFKVI